MKITGILLAGGSSKRMGMEKGQLKIGTRFLYEYPLQVLENLCDEILISTCKGFFETERHTLVCDELAGIGPLGGIYTCLKKSSNKLNVVLSYDLPLVNEGLLNYLISESNTGEVVLPASKPNRPEPLCGIYNKSILPVLNRLIEQKRYAVHGILPLVRSRILVMDETMSFYRPDLFLNMNRKSDLEKLPEGFGHEG